MQFLRSNAHWPIPAQSRTCAHLTCLCVRAQALIPNKQCSSAFERTSLAFERTCRACYIFAWLQSIVVPALERTSAAAAADPRQCMCSVFCFFLFYLIFSFYLFGLCLFIYLLFLVFVSIINCFNMLISLLINYLFSLFMLVFVYFIFVVIVSCGIY
jgi:hypothetical protein